MEQRLVLIIESDINAIAQMRRVLAALGLRVFAVSEEDALRDVSDSLLRAGTPPSLIVARVALPTGSGIRMMEETAAQFPDAGCLLVSHHPRTLLMSVPGFAKYAGDFLQAEFTDDQFRAAVVGAIRQPDLAKNVMQP
jgi:DNA-binding NtrC family response regulator